MVETLKRCGPTQSKSGCFQNSKISPVCEQPTIHCQARVKSLQWLDAVKIRQLCKFSAARATSQILCRWCMSAVLHASLMPFFVQVLCCIVQRVKFSGARATSGQHGANWWLPCVWPSSVCSSACVLDAGCWFNPRNASFFGTNFYPGWHQLFYSFVTLWHIITTFMLSSFY